MRNVHSKTSWKSEFCHAVSVSFKKYYKLSRHPTISAAHIFSTRGWKVLGFLYDTYCTYSVHFEKLCKMYDFPWQISNMILKNLFQIWMAKEILGHQLNQIFSMYQFWESTEYLKNFHFNKLLHFLRPWTWKRHCTKTLLIPAVQGVLYVFCQVQWTYHENSKSSHYVSLKTTKIMKEIREIKKVSWVMSFEQKFKAMIFLCKNSVNG